MKAEQTTLRGELTATKKEDKAVSDVPKLSDERDAPLYEHQSQPREDTRAS